MYQPEVEPSDILKSISIGDGAPLGNEQSAQQPQLAADALPEAAQGYTVNVLAQHAQQQADGGDIRRIGGQ